MVLETISRNQGSDLSSSTMIPQMISARMQAQEISPFLVHNSLVAEHKTLILYQYNIANLQKRKNQESKQMAAQFTTQTAHQAYHSDHEAFLNAWECIPRSATHFNRQRDTKRCTKHWIHPRSQILCPHLDHTLCPSLAWLL
jgi:hypothetical protein